MIISSLKIGEKINKNKALLKNKDQEIYILPIDSRGRIPLPIKVIKSDIFNGMVVLKIDKKMNTFIIEDMEQFKIPLQNAFEKSIWKKRFELVKFI